MTPLSLVLLAGAAAFAIGDWLAVWFDLRRLEYVCKPGVMAALIAMALALRPASEVERLWLTAGLALGLVGDVLLMLPERWFCPAWSPS